MNDDLYKYPRLYVDAPLSAGHIALSPDQAHYLRNVMRRVEGEEVRVFNGRDGEWLGALQFSGKRDATIAMQMQVRLQVERKRRVHLFFAPLKKDRMDILVNTAVQLDATDLHPIISERTEVREVKADKLNAYIIEAAEQCERMDLPALHPIVNLDRITMPLFAGLERSDAKPLNDALVPAGDCACLIGPVGGWTQAEREHLNNAPHITPVTLGPNVLRSETAVAAMLTRLASSGSL